MELDKCKIVNRAASSLKALKKIPMKRQLKKAVIVGVNYAGTEAELGGCINDANKMKNYLLDVCKFKKENVILLTDHFAAKPDELPTRSNILKAINWLTSQLPPRKECQLVFHYSGHGSFTRDRDGDESDQKDETICPVDCFQNGDITDDDLKDLLVDSLPSNAKLFCLLDCCHSGTGLDLRYQCRVYGDKHNKNYRLQQNKKQSHSPGEVILFSGCKDEQYSADAYIKGKYQGALTWAFFTVLEKHNFEPISYKRLIREIHTLLRRHRYEQIPQLSCGQYVDLKNTFCLTD